MQIQILSKIITVLFLCLFLKSCGGLPKPGDARTMEMEGEARARKNIEEGRGFSLNKAVKGSRKTTYEFSTSNPMWRATFDVIEFMPLVTVDYSGGMIITDWYTDPNTTDDSLKFTIRFLSNEIRADSLKIIIHKKTCKTQSNCIVKRFASAKIEDAIRTDIIKKAVILDAESKAKEKKKKR
tara:strand:- start:1144 stop:1689 length:546 start_codon:yes stop_codon:yes gene_type:complete